MHENCAIQHENHMLDLEVMAVGVKFKDTHERGSLILIGPDFKLIPTWTSIPCTQIS